MSLRVLSFRLQSYIFGPKSNTEDIKDTGIVAEFVLPKKNIICDNNFQVLPRKHTKNPIY
jgi:hypothetical protein